MAKAIRIGLARRSACLGLSVGLALAAGGLSSCAPVIVAQERPLGQAFDDAQGAARLKTRLLASEGYDLRGVDVEMHNGVVVLTGTVGSVEERLEAERLAWEVGAIDRVGNEIVVDEPGGFVRNVKDEWINTRVRARIMADSEIRSINFNIETHKNVVYLMGVARSRDELEKVAAHASYVDGVDQVVSYMSVRR